MRMRRWAAGLALVGAAAAGVQMAGAQQEQEPAQDQRAEATPAMSDAQRRSYAIGFILRHRLAEEGIQVDEQAFIRGFLAVQDDAPPAMTPQEMEDALRQLLRERAATQDGTGDEPGATRGPRPGYTAQSQGPTGPGTYIQPGVNLRLDARLPSGRIDTALPTTRENTIRANDGDDD